MARACENTLPAFEAALAAGARYVELDVQFSRDGAPMVFHDDALERLTGHRGKVVDRDAVALGRLHARHRGFRALIPSLEQVVSLFNRHPDVTLFAELKTESIAHFGIAATVRTVAGSLAAARFPWVLISFDARAVAYARRHLHVPVGWVLLKYNSAHRARTEKLRPDYVFCDAECLPREGAFAWPGPWQWVIYDIVDQHEARMWLTRGAHLIETGCITDMLSRTRTATFE